MWAVSNSAGVRTSSMRGGDPESSSLRRRVGSMVATTDAVMTSFRFGQGLIPRLDTRGGILTPMVYIPRVVLQALGIYPMGYTYYSSATVRESLRKDDGNEVHPVLPGLSIARLLPDR